MTRAMASTPPAPTAEDAASPASVAAAGSGRRQAAPRPAGQPRTPLRADLAMTALMALGVASAWALSRAGLFQSGDDFSYRIAIVGGVMMLLVFLYPLRKHLRAWHGWGPARLWLWVHIAFGLVGPWLILLHSTFRIGSLNAGVALASMVVVVLSGVVGRFLYVRVHRSLDAERRALQDLRRRIGFAADEAGGEPRSRLHYAPEVEVRLRGFEHRALQAGPQGASVVGRLVALPLRQWQTARQCRRAVRQRLREHAPAQGWTEAELRRRQRQASRLVAEYLAAVVRVGQFSAYDRVFALWHVAHLPFVVLLVISAVVHVVAVHAY